MTPVFYLWTHSLTWLLIWTVVNAYFTLGSFAWFAIYLPELFATHIRATASSFVFNASRFLAFLGPIFAGSLIATFHGTSGVAVSLAFVYILGLIVVPFMPKRVTNRCRSSAEIKGAVPKRAAFFCLSRFSDWWTPASASEAG